MGIPKLRKSVFKYIESELYSYHHTLTEINKLKNDMILCRDNTDENVGGGRSTTVSKPTEQIATRIYMDKRIQRLEEVTNAIEKVYTGLPDTHQSLIKLVYWTKPQTLSWDGIAQKLNVSRRQAFVWRDNVINVLAEILGYR